MTTEVEPKSRTAGTAELSKLTATEIVRATTAGEITCEAVTRACLDRISERESVVHAFASIDPELALAQARALDRAPTRGPLHGVPVGVKDIIDTCDQPTEMGSPVYGGYRPAADAACVALVRAAGAVILGKTVTCEFAGMTSGATTNPHDVTRTPGGSSSGSGAAVADRMATVAFGTQTGGSVLRPAAYCGVFGFKPTYNAFNRRGVFPAAESLDTLGLMARSLDDIELVSDVLELRPPSQPVTLTRPPRVGLCRTHLWATSQPETAAAVEDAAARLGKAGAVVKDIALPEEFSGLRTAARETINNYERAAAMAHEWNTHRDAISEKLRKRIELGRATPHADYLAAIRLGEECRARLGVVFDGCDVLLAPAVHGEAPVGLAETGDPSFQAIWTILHVPALTLPTHRGPNGMPVGIQLVAQPHEDRRLFACARWVWQQLGMPDRIGYQR